MHSFLLLMRVWGNINWGYIHPCFTLISLWAPSLSGYLNFTLFFRNVFNIFRNLLTWHNSLAKSKWPNCPLYSKPTTYYLYTYSDKRWEHCETRMNDIISAWIVPFLDKRRDNATHIPIIQDSIPSSSKSNRQLFKHHSGSNGASSSGKSNRAGSSRRDRTCAAFLGRRYSTRKSDIPIGCRIAAWI